jgi:hypothetical protein
MIRKSKKKIGEILDFTFDIQLILIRLLIGKELNMDL